MSDHGKLQDVAKYAGWLAAAAVTALATPTVAQPAAVQAHLTGDEGNVHVVSGKLGPSGETLLVVTFDLRGVGSYRGFALVPTATAKGGYRKVAVPKLPVGTLDGKTRTALIANLDKDPADEVVLELSVQRAARNHSYATVEYVVLDYRSKAFVRVKKLEAKLAAAMKARGASVDALDDATLRTTLGVVPET